MDKERWKEIHYEETDSTNLRAKQYARELREETSQTREIKVVFTADLQTAGRGRLGRVWESPKGDGLWMSLLLRPELSPASASMLTLIAALAAAEGIENVLSVKTQIKWPNDLVVNGKKICGILTEMHADLQKIDYVVIGIGVNANMTGFPEELQEKATSLYLCSGQKTDPDLLKQEILASFDHFYEEFQKCGDLSGVKDIYEKRLANKGREVRILPTGAGISDENRGSEEWTGTCLGINEKGELLIQDTDGSVKTILSGEVSVRGIYGYV